MKYDNRTDMMATFAFVVQKDGLDEEGLKKELSEHVDVIEIKDDDDSRIFILKGSFADYLYIKLNYICLAHPENDYILFPMGSYEEKQEAKRILGLQ